MGKSLKGKELGTGITQRKDGRYVGRFVNRFGKRQTVYGKTLTEVKDNIREAQYLDEKEENVINEKTTLDEWFEIWIDTYKKHCRNTTIRSYEVKYNAIKDDLGWRKLKKLNLVILQQAFNKLCSDQKRKACRALLIDMFDRAIEADLLIKNPARFIKTKVTNDIPQERRILSKEEVEILYDATNREGTIYRLLLLGLNTGMRIGEMIGLCWDCVDFENNVIHIRRTLTRLSNNGNPIYELHKTKTISSERDIPMTKAVKVMLLEQKLTCAKIKNKYDPAEGFEDLVFPSRTNHPQSPSNVRLNLNHLIKKIQEDHPDFKPFTPHCLRHTFATNCIEAGMQPKTLQKILGHKSLAMTMDLYTHVRDSTVKEQMGLIAEMA